MASGLRGPPSPARPQKQCCRFYSLASRAGGWVDHASHHPQQTHPERQRCMGHPADHVSDSLGDIAHARFVEGSTSGLAQRSGAGVLALVAMASLIASLAAVALHSRLLAQSSCCVIAASGLKSSRAWRQGPLARLHVVRHRRRRASSPHFACVRRVAHARQPHLAQPARKLSQGRLVRKAQRPL